MSGGLGNLGGLGSIGALPAIQAAPSELGQAPWIANQLAQQPQQQAILRSENTQQTAQQRALAQQQLGFLSNLAASGNDSPELFKAAAAAAKTLGVPAPTDADSLLALSGYAKNWASMTPTELQQFMYYPPEVRKALSSGAHPRFIGVPEDVMNLPQQTPWSAGLASKLQGDFDKNYAAVTQGQMLPDQFTAWWDANQKQLAPILGTDPTTWLSQHPEVFSGLSKAVIAKIALLEDKGILSKAQASKASADVKNAKSLAGLRDAQAKVWNERASWEPTLRRDQAQYYTSMANQAGQHSALYKAQIDQLGPKALQGEATALGRLSAIVTPMTAERDRIDGDISRLTTTIQQAYNTSSAVSQDALNQLDALRSQRDTIQDNIDQANATIDVMRPKVAPHLTGGKPMKFNGANGTPTAQYAREYRTMSPTERAKWLMNKNIPAWVRQQVYATGLPIDPMLKPQVLKEIGSGQATKFPSAPQPGETAAPYPGQ